MFYFIIILIKRKEEHKRLGNLGSGTAKFPSEKFCSVLASLPRPKVGVLARSAAEVPSPSMPAPFVEAVLNYKLRSCKRLDFFEFSARIKKPGLG